MIVKAHILGAAMIAYSEREGRFLSSQLIAPRGEAAIWARLIESQPRELTPEAAKYLLALQFNENDQARVQQLANRSEAGTLSEDEGREYDSYLHIANLLAIMQSKARVALNNEAPHSRS